MAKGIVIDTEPLNAIGNVSGDTIEVQPEAALESVLRATLDKGYTLPVTTRCIRLSVGGFISAGGEGRGSQRYGAFVDQVAELDVVTGDGALRLGAKRYAPYGGTVSAGEWTAHNGNATYARLQAAKTRFDPHSVLSPGTGMFS